MLPGVAGQDRSKVADLIDEVGDEPGKVALRQPVVQRPWQQQNLLRVKRP